MQIGLKGAIFLIVTAYDHIALYFQLASDTTTMKIFMFTKNT